MADILVPTSLNFLSGVAWIGLGEQCCQPSSDNPSECTARHDEALDPVHHVIVISFEALVFSH